jgi:hypothetical protein
VSEEVIEATLAWPDVEICQGAEDVQAQVTKLKECDVDRKELELLREKDKVQEQRVANLEKEIALLKQELELKDRVIAVKDMEIGAQVRAFNDMKEVADRAIKLAETSKPKSNWLYAVGAVVAAFAIGLALGL